MIGNRGNGSDGPVRLLLASAERSEARPMVEAFDRADDLQLVSTADSVAALRRAVRSEECDVLLVDRDLPGGGAVGAARSLGVQPGGRPRAVVMGVAGSPGAILEHLQVGYLGFVTRPVRADQAMAMIRAVIRNELPAEPKLSFALARRVAGLTGLCRERGLDLGLLSCLTARQRQVLRLVAGGHSNQEIGARLGIRLGTVKSHVHEILKRLGVRSRHQAAVFVPSLDEEA